MTVTVDLGAGWRFGGPVTEAPVPYDWPAPELVDAFCGRTVDDRGYDEVHLPHCVAPLSWRDWDPASWEKIFVYRRHFDAPAELAGRRVFAEIGPALTCATVVLNGRVVARHAGGYLPCHVELPPLDTSDNVLAVLVDGRFNLNVPPNLPVPASSASIDFWQPAGLYGRAVLRGLPEVFLADVFAKPVDVLTPERRVAVTCTVDAAAEVRDGVVSVALHGPGAGVVASAQAPVRVAAGDRATVTLALAGLPEVELWDVDHPVLYQVVATLQLAGEPVHAYRTRIGFRQARFHTDGFFLNGRRLDLFGANRHGLFPYAGQAMPDRVQRRDAEILRNELNCVMVRCAHYPQSPAFLDACDELGLLVWEEAPGWQYLGDQRWQDRSCADITAMIVRDRNRPSIVVWGARLNETLDHPEFYTRTQRLAAELDDSRQTSGTIFEPYYHTTDFQQDVFSYDDYATEQLPGGGRRPALLPPRTQWPYLIAEAVSARSSPTGFYRRDDPPEVQPQQALDYAVAYQAVRADPRYCGLLAWCGFDYQSGALRTDRGVKHVGLADSFRVPKPGAALFQAQVDPRRRPVAQPAFYWDPDSTPGPDAMICANCDRLEIFLDGAHHATVTPDRSRFGRLAYPPSFVDLTVAAGTRPELRIDGYVDGQLAVSRRFAGDRAGDRLALAVDDPALRADGADATRAVFRVVDRFGESRASATGTVSLALAGPAVLVGDLSFDLAAGGGVGAVWVRSLPGRAGEVVLRAHHPTLGSAEARLRSWSPAAPTGAMVDQDLDAAEGKWGDAG